MGRQYIIKSVAAARITRLLEKRAQGAHYRRLTSAAGKPLGASVARKVTAITPKSLPLAYEQLMSAGRPQGLSALAGGTRSTGVTAARKYLVGKALTGTLTAQPGSGLRRLWNLLSGKAQLAAQERMALANKNVAPILPGVNRHVNAGKVYRPDIGRLARQAKGLPSDWSTYDRAMHTLNTKAQGHISTGDMRRLNQAYAKMHLLEASKGLTDATRNTWLARGAVAAPFIGGAAYAASRDGGGRNAMPGYQQPYVYG